MKIFSNVYVSTAGPRRVTIRVDLDGTVRVNFAAPPWYQPELMEDFIIPRGHGADVVIQVPSPRCVPLQIELERDFGGIDLTEEAIRALHTEIIHNNTKITADNLPIGPRWEQDGSCWEAKKWPLAAAPGWRWCPMNAKAFGKGEPQGDMTDHPPPFGFPEPGNQ